MPPYAVQATARVRTLAGRLSQDHRTSPTQTSWRRRRAASPKKLFNLMQLQQKPLRLNCYGDEGTTDPRGSRLGFSRFAAADRRLTRQPQEELHEWIEKALRALPDRQQEVIRLRFGLTDRRARTLLEVGQTLSADQRADPAIGT